MEYDIAIMLGCVGLWLNIVLTHLSGISEGYYDV